MKFRGGNVANAIMAKLRRPHGAGGRQLEMGGKRRLRLCGSHSLKRGQNRQVGQEEQASGSVFPVLFPDWAFCSACIGQLGSLLQFTCRQSTCVPVLRFENFDDFFGHFPGKFPPHSSRPRHSAVESVWIRVGTPFRSFKRENSNTNDKTNAAILKRTNS
jgi:hypothetical protein